MIQTGERTVAAAPAGRWLAAIRSYGVVLAGEVLSGSAALTRFSLVVLAIALQTSILEGPGSFRPAGNGFFGALVSLQTLGCLACVLLSTLQVTSLLNVTVRRIIAVSALVLVCMLSVVGVRQSLQGMTAIAGGMPYTNDGAVMDLDAAQIMRTGHDPYRSSSIVSALADINASARTVTPLMDGQFRGLHAYPSDAAIEQAFLNDLRYRTRHGVSIPSEFESKYNYPSGSFLIIFPFVWAGIHDMRFLYMLAVLGIAAYLFRRLPRSLQPLLPLLILSDVPLIAHMVGGQPDPIYALFLMLGYAEWPRRWMSPVTMGLAAATKQLAWFFLPFYLALVITRLGWREGIRRSGIMLAIFLATNGPFILQSPSSYMSSIMAPMSDPMFPLGIGIIALFVSNALPMLPKVAFTLAEIGSLVGALTAFVRIRLLTPASGIILASLPLFFAWRSLINYFYLIPLIALGVILAETRRESIAHFET